MVTIAKCRSLLSFRGWIYVGKILIELMWYKLKRDDLIGKRMTAKFIAI